MSHSAWRASRSWSASLISENGASALFTLEAGAHVRGVRERREVHAGPAYGFGADELAAPAGARAAAIAKQGSLIATYGPRRDGRRPLLRDRGASVATRRVATR